MRKKIAFLCSCALSALSLIPVANCAGHREDRRPAFAFGDDGDFGNVAARRGADGGRRDQRRRRGKSRRDELQNQAGRRRSRLQLASLCREGQAIDRAGQSRGDLWLLDFGQPQIGAAGLRSEIHQRRKPVRRRPAVLSRAIRRRRTIAQHFLHRRFARTSSSSPPPNT